MPNFDPGQPLPDETAPNTVVTVPISQPNQLGGAFVAAPPNNPNPSGHAPPSSPVNLTGNPDLGGQAPVPLYDAATSPWVPRPAAPGPGPVAQTPTPAADATPTVPTPTVTGGNVPRATTPAPDAAGTRVLGDSDAARKLQADLPDAQATAAAAQADADTMISDQQRRNATDLEAQRRLDKLDRDKINQDIAAARDKAANTPYHSFWADKSAGQQVLAGLGILLGSVSFSADHQNQALKLLQDGIAQDFEKQKEEHAALWKDVEARQQAGRDLSSDQYREMAEQEKSQAAQLESVKNQALALAGPSAAKRDGILKQLDALGVTAGIDEKYANYGLLAKKAMEEERHDKAQEGIERTKAGAEVMRARGEGNDRATVLISNAVERNLDKDPTTKDLLTKREKYNEVVQAMDSGNGIAKGAGLDELTKAATGLGARKASVQIFSDRSGGLGQQLLGALQKAQNGDPLTPSQTKVIRDASVYLRDQATRSAGAVAKRHEDALNKVFPGRQDVVHNVIASRFGTDEQPSAGAPPSSNQVTEGRTATGPNGQKMIFRGGKWQPI